ncbi:MAG: HlyD family type I secretion periplasmic adaptor subunit [Rhodocyclaceae bacterium]|nr:HlyD family type I secretion periplasmic adaptor subunit [Rhodocyclaceae bacterium]
MNKSTKQFTGQSTGPRLGSRQRHLLSEAAHVEDELLPAFVRPALFLTSTMVVMFIIWAAITPLTEVARSPGEIVPSGQNKVVQHLDGGMVVEIKVEEYDLVKAGQVVMRIEGTQAAAELSQMETRFAALKLRAERLQAFAEGKTPQYPKADERYASLTEDQDKIFTAQVDARTSSLSVMTQQLAQRNNRIVQIEHQIESARVQQKMANELAAMREELAAKNLVSKTALLEAKRAKAAADGEFLRVSSELKVVSEEIGEIRNRRTDTGNQLKREAMSEMGTVRAEIAEVSDSIERLRGRVERLEVRAPLSGHVHDLQVTNVGQVVQPGAILMQIVPDNAPLEAMIRIQPKDVGHVHVGQPANLRVTSYDYSRFGYAKGTLKRISASSLLDEQKQPYYRGWITLAHPYVGTEPGKYPLQSGMSLEAEILTGEKTLLAYLAKPVTDALTKSFRER